MAKYRTISFNENLHKELSELADKVASKEGLSRVSLVQLIERMKKTYLDNVEL